MTDATDELRELATVLTAHAKALHKAVEMARHRSAVMREVSRLLRDSSQAKREHAETVRERRTASSLELGL
jgi:hypothetical protein